MIKCADTRPCFAKGINSGCIILTQTYDKGKCPFCKRDARITNGKYYPATNKKMPR